MKKQRNLFNQRMSWIKGFMVFTLILFGSVMFADSFDEIGKAIAGSLDLSSGFSVNIGDGIGLVGSGLAAGPVLLTIKGDPFEIKSEDQLKAMKDDERETYTTELFEAQTKAILKLQEELKEKGENDLEIIEKLSKLRDEGYKSMQAILKKQGLELESLKIGNLNMPIGAEAQVTKWLKDNHDEIIKIKKQGSGMIELEIKAVAAITTGSATNPDGIPALVGTQVAPPSNVNLMDVFVESLTTTINTTLAAYAYTESVPKDGNFDFIAEGGSKPQIDFKIETRYAEPVKIAAHEVLTTESVQDIVGLQSIATDFLRKKHNLKRQNGILFGDGLGENPQGATVYGRAFVAGAMANKVATPNIMDIINACITDVYTTHNYQDEMPYLPSLVMMNPVDFFLEFVSAKDGDGKPLFPTAVLFNRVNVGGVLIIPFRDIPTDKIFVADMSKYNTTNYIGYSVRIGWIHDQFITNQFTMIGESRFHAFVKKLDEQAFIYDDISTVKAAILKP